jgi:hypothetical protein
MTDESVIKKHGEMVLTGENRSTGERVNGEMVLTGENRSTGKRVNGEMVLTGENRSTGERVNRTCTGQVLDLYVRSQRLAFG